jgi:hypothetical protein
MRTSPDSCLGRGQGSGLDGLGQFGQGALGGLHRVGQQAVRLADLVDFLLERGALGLGGDHEHVDVASNRPAVPKPAATPAPPPRPAAPQEGADRHGQEQVAEEQKAVGLVRALANGCFRLPGWNRPSIGVSDIYA